MPSVLLDEPIQLTYEFYRAALGVVLATPCATVREQIPTLYREIEELARVCTEYETQRAQVQPRPAAGAAPTQPVRNFRRVALRGRGLSAAE